MVRISEQEEYRSEVLVIFDNVDACMTAVVQASDLSAEHAGVSCNGENDCEELVHKIRYGKTFKKRTKSGQGKFMTSGTIET